MFARSDENLEMTAWQACTAPTAGSVRGGPAGQRGHATDCSFLGLRHVCATSGSYRSTFFSENEVESVAIMDTLVGYRFQHRYRPRSLTW